VPPALMGTMIALIYKREHPKYKNENPKYKREHPKWLVHSRVDIGNVPLGSTHVNIDGYPSMKKIAYQKITCSVQQSLTGIKFGRRRNTKQRSLTHLSKGIHVGLLGSVSDVVQLQRNFGVGGSCLR
jgi:hypothetical protein